VAYNFLEQLAAEWLEFQGYFVRRNVRVGPRKNGGYQCELDIVAFHPVKKHLLQIEPSMDARSWKKRGQRYKKKFKAGKKYIPSLFTGLKVPKKINQIALLGLASSKNHKKLGGGDMVTIQAFMGPILEELQSRRVASRAVPENFVLLRTLQFVCEHRATFKDIFDL